MTAPEKLVDSLTVRDLEEHPVWEFTNRDENSELLVRAVEERPASTPNGRVIGTKVRFANGHEAWAVIGNIDGEHPSKTEHFVAIVIEHEGEWFPLARYHDVDYGRRGPAQLAQLWGLDVDEVFPISFDVGQYVRGNPASLAGSILKEPRERLSRAELRALAIPRRSPR